MQDTRIIDAFSACAADLSDADRVRNSFGASVMFLHQASSLAHTVSSQLPYTCKEAVDGGDALACSFSPEQGLGCAGTLRLPRSQVYAAVNQTIKSPYTEIMRAPGDIASNGVQCFEYSLPPAGRHASRLLVGVNLPPPALRVEDLMGSRYPRLNKGRFNIVDMILKRGNASSLLQYPGAGAQQPQQQYQQQFYQQQQYQQSYQQQPMGYGPSSSRGITYSGAGGGLGGQQSLPSYMQFDARMSPPQYPPYQPPQQFYPQQQSFAYGQQQSLPAYSSSGFSGYQPSTAYSSQAQASRGGHLPVSYAGQGAKYSGGGSSGMSRAEPVQQVNVLS